MQWIDDWLPAWHFEEVHHIHSQAGAGALLDAAQAHDPSGDRLIGSALAMREAPARLLAKLGGRSVLAQRSRFGKDDFLPLGRDGDRALAYGLVGRFWQPGYGLVPMADPAAFLAHQGVSEAKLLLAFEVQDDGKRGRRVTTRTRVACNDAAARRRLALYWALIRPVSGLIRQRILAAVRRAAEAA